MRKREKLVDVESYALAEHFLFDNRNMATYTEECTSLAQAIQQAVEDWFEFEKPGHGGSMIDPRSK